MIDYLANVDGLEYDLELIKAVLEYDALGAHYLIIRFITHDNKNDLLPLINTTDTQQIEHFLLLIPEDKRWITDEPLIRTWIETQESRLFYRTRQKMGQRRDSLCIEIDGLRHHIGFFHSSGSLGKGTEGEVRRFTDKNTRKSWVVKTPLDEEIIDSDKDYLDSMEQQLAISSECSRKAYPDNPGVLVSRRTPSSFTYREVASFVDGMTIRNYLERIRDQKIFAQCFLDIAEELDRIHQVGVIHGDLKGDNIMITHGGKIRFIDFGFSAFKGQTGPFVSLQGLEEAGHLAPERYEYNSDLTATAEQDTFSFGEMLRYYYRPSKYTRTSFDSQLDTILQTIIYEATMFEVRARPSLQSIIERLRSSHEATFKP